MVGKADSPNNDRHNKACALTKSLHQRYYNVKQYQINEEVRNNETNTNKILFSPSEEL
jgi:hypothetical protein